MPCHIPSPLSMCRPADCLAAAVLLCGCDSFMLSCPPCDPCARPFASLLSSLTLCEADFLHNACTVFVCLFAEALSSVLYITVSWMSVNNLVNASPKSLGSRCAIKQSKQMDVAEVFTEQHSLSVYTISLWMLPFQRNNPALFLFVCVLLLYVVLLTWLPLLIPGLAVQLPLPPTVWHYPLIYGGPGDSWLQRFRVIKPLIGWYLQQLDIDKMH